MLRFMVITFLLLGWGFFELSGGTDFVPPQREAAPLNALMQQVASDEGAAVTRASAAQTVTILGEPSVRPTAGAVSPAVREVPTAATPSTLASFGQLAPATAPEPETPAAASPEEAPAPVEPVQEAPALSASLDLREVTGTRVNMRTGPGTNFDVITQLVQGDQAEVLETSANGWVNIRVLATGEEGWMAARLMSPVN